MHIKTERMTQFDIFHVFVENSLNSELCFFYSLLKPAKIWNLSKNEIFRIIKAHGQKNQLPSTSSPWV
jgi:hypothetical protein